MSLLEGHCDILQIFFQILFILKKKVYRDTKIIMAIYL